MAAKEPRPVYLYIFGSLILLLGFGTMIAAILFPLLSNSTGAKQANLCMDNMRSIALGLRSYALDYDDRFPDGERWMDRIVRQVPGENPYNCPSAKGGYGYAFSSEVAAKPVAEISSPFLEPMAFDSTLTGRSAVGTVETMPNPGRHNRRGIGNVLANVEGGVEYRPTGVRRGQTGQ